MSYASMTLLIQLANGVALAWIAYRQHAIAAQIHDIHEAAIGHHAVIMATTEPELELDSVSVDPTPDKH